MSANHHPSLPASLEEALATPPPRPVAATPTLLAAAALWGGAALALHAVIFPAKAPVAVARVPGAPVTASDALELTGEVVTALAADQFGSLLFKIELAQKVAQRLSPPSNP